MSCCSPFLRPAAFPQPSPPPISVGFVRCFNGTTQPSDSSSVPRQLRLLDFLSRPGPPQRLRARRGLPGSNAILSYVMWPQTPAGHGPSHDGTAHIAFSCSDSLGPCDFKDFVVQSHTPHDHCVRFE